MVSERFWAKVTIGSADACWPWTACANDSGYGLFGVGGKLRTSNRIAYELSIGPIPDGLRVCHKCDNPGCCNPRHLFVATQRQNMLDRDIKGRNGRAKITAEDVRGIRQLFAQGVTYRELMARFGLKSRAIARIISRNGWSHVA